ncbi:hypothetical protein GGR56DRAFT_654347 [Xylariaceae sp. FL0804]|nr:hypothetical protein GGR56DRAFT_654347 [Xylariaceae sp. FL0804]
MPLRGAAARMTSAAQVASADASTRQLRERSTNAAKRASDANAEDVADAGPQTKKPRQASSHDSPSDAATQPVQDDEVVATQPAQDETAAVNGATRLLVTDWLPFKAPFEGDMHLEVICPPNSPRNASIQLFGPRDYWGMDATFTLPFSSIEQVIVSKHLSRKKDAYLVLIVPRSATGTAPVRQRYPQIITFSFPDCKADKNLSGEVGHAADPKTDTYLSILVKVFHDHLRQFDKKVTSLCHTTNPLYGIDATLEPVPDTDLQVKTKGSISLLDTGLLFLSKTVRIFVPLKELNGLRAIAAIHGNGTVDLGKMIGLKLLCNVTVPSPQPLTKTQQEREVLGGGNGQLHFHKLSPSVLKHIREYSQKHHLGIQFLKQYYYSFEQDQPATCWMPLSEASLEKLVQ